MKILFINKYDTYGGAAIAAWRLKKGLEQYHQVSGFMICALKRSNDSNVVALRTNKWEDMLAKAYNLGMSLLGMQYLFFPVNSRRILRYARTFKPDVISLHNTHGGYFQTSLIKQLSKMAPVVWTLHDMWAFTANAAHTFGDESWKLQKAAPGERKNYPAIGIPTGRFLMQHKKNIYTKSNLTLVTPSYWLQNLAVKSPLLADKKVVRIPNGIDRSVFYPRDKAKARSLWQIPETAQVVMFSADNVTGSYFKGGKDLLSVLHRINHSISGKLYVLMVGKSSPDALQGLTNLVAVQTGYIHSEEQMAMAYSAADLYFYPTKADNLPNTLVEAISCGLPCVTFDVGGCNEIIENGYNGLVVKAGDYDAFAEETIQLLNDHQRCHQFSAHALEKAKTEFDLTIVSNSYFQLFNQLITTR